MLPDTVLFDEQKMSVDKGQVRYRQRTNLSFNGELLSLKNLQSNKTITSYLHFYWSVQNEKAPINHIEWDEQVLTRCSQSTVHALAP